MIVLSRSVVRGMKRFREYDGVSTVLRYYDTKILRSCAILRDPARLGHRQTVRAGDGWGGPGRRQPSRPRGDESTITITVPRVRDTSSSRCFPRAVWEHRRVPRADWPVRSPDGCVAAGPIASFASFALISPMRAMSLPMIPFCHVNCECMHETGMQRTSDGD